MNGPSPISPEECAAIVGSIDHALLDPRLGAADLAAGCRMARACGTASVCIVPWAVGMAAEILAGSSVRPSTTIGFPHGSSTTAVKLAESARALADGAVELDVVVNQSWVRDGAWDAVRDEILALVDATHAGGGRLKVIFENCHLDDAAKRTLCAICTEAGADWVKTSTGFASGGATEADVALMRAACPPRVGVKASGGIRDLDTLLGLRAKGADRFGASRTHEIVAEARRRAGLPPIAPE